jgi:GNAT superfamily N-acetyltransferase
MTAATDVAEALAHRGRLMAQRVERVIELPWGSALWHRDLPRVHDLNIVRIPGDAEDLDARELAAVVDRLQGDLSYRRLEFWDEGVAERFLPGLEAAGFNPDMILLMAYRGEARATPAVEPATLDDITPLEAEWLHSDLPSWEPDHEELVRQILASHAITHAAIPSRCFCVRDGRKAVAMATLFDEGPIVLVEDVYVTPSHRGRGLGALVVDAAATAGLEQGAQLVYLPTDGNGLARLFYRRLGWTELSVVTRFLKRAP